MMLPRCRLVLGAMLLKRALRPFHARPWSGVREGAKYNGPLCHGRPSFHDLPVQSKHPGAVVALFVACVQVAPSCLFPLPAGSGVGLRHQGGGWTIWPWCGSFVYLCAHFLYSAHESHPTLLPARRLGRPAFRQRGDGHWCGWSTPVLATALHPDRWRPKFAGGRWCAAGRQENARPASEP